MQARHLFHRLSDRLWIAGSVGLVVMAVTLDRYFRVLDQRTSIDPADPAAFVSPEKRYEGMDVNVGEGFRWTDGDGQWEIRVGSFDIRRRSVGFLRLGAFNEAALADLKIVVSRSFLDSVIMPEADSRERDKAVPTATGVPREDAAPSVDRTAAGGTARSQERKNTVARDSWPGLLCQKYRVSGFQVGNLTVSVRENDGSEAVLLRCDTASLAGAESVPRLRLRGNVALRNMRGEGIDCREADLIVASDRYPVVARKGIGYTEARTQTFDRVSFPLSALGAATEFSRYLPAVEDPSAYY